MPSKYDSDRLTLRPLQESDHDLILSLTREASMFADVIHDESFWDVYNETCWKETTNPASVNFLIFLKEGPTFCGRINLRGTDTPMPEMGIDLLRQYRNQGIGPEAIRLFSLWVREELGIAEVKVCIDPANEHSIHVFEKLGAKRVGKDYSFLDKLLQLTPEDKAEKMRADLDNACPIVFVFPLPTG